MTYAPMTFAEALSKIIVKDMEGHPEWQLSHVGRLDASTALNEIMDKEQGRNSQWKI